MGQMGGHWDTDKCTHHIWQVLMLFLRLFHLFHPFPTSSFGSGYIFLYYLSLFLFIFSWFHLFPHIIWNSSSALFPSASLRDLHMLFILGCILLWCPCEPELEVRAGLVHLCISCFSEGKTRWNVPCLTLILLSYLCFFPSLPQKRRKKKRKWPTSSPVWSASREVKRESM